MPDFTHSSVLVHGICIPSLAHQKASTDFLCRSFHRRCAEFQEKSKFRHSFLDPQPLWTIDSIMEILHHALPIKIKIVKFKWVGGRECGKNCFGAMMFKNKVIWWCSGLGVNTTTMCVFYLFITYVCVLPFYNL